IFMGRAPPPDGWTSRGKRVSVPAIRGRAPASPRQEVHMARWKLWSVTAGVALVAGVLFAALPAAGAASPGRRSLAPLVGGAHVSSVARPQAMGTGGGGRSVAPA